jgi:hypothetical protein
VEIIGKVKDGRFDAVEQTVAQSLRASGHSAAAKVRPVFPGLTSGHRAGLFVVEVPDDLPPRTMNAVIESLRQHEAVEYAELPAGKHPA